MEVLDDFLVDFTICTLLPFRNGVISTAASIAAARTVEDIVPNMFPEGSDTIPIRQRLS